MSDHDPSKYIPRPEASIVRDAEGEERVAFLLPVNTDDVAWTSSFDEAVDAVSSQLLRRGGHGRDLDYIRTCLLARLDRTAMASWLANGFISRLMQEIRQHLQISLDLRLSRVDCSPSGSMELLTLTSRLQDAATVFNCVASIDPSGMMERARDKTASMREFDWGILLMCFVRCIGAVSPAKSSVHTRILLDLCKEGLLEQAVIRGLDQKALKVDIYGAFPLDMDRAGATVH